MNDHHPIHRDERKKRERSPFALTFSACTYEGWPASYPVAGDGGGFGRALSASGVSGVVRLPRSYPSVTVHLADRDARPYETQQASGIVELRTGGLSNSDPHG
jgi:hypothetical protein